MVNLLAIWRAQGLDAILREAWQRGIVLAGLERRLDVLVRVGRHDARTGQPAVARGLGFLPGIELGPLPTRAGAAAPVPAGDRAPGSSSRGSGCEDQTGALFEDAELVETISAREGPRSGTPVPRVRRCDRDRSLTRVALRTAARRSTTCATRSGAAQTPPRGRGTVAAPRGAPAGARSRTERPLPSAGSAFGGGDARRRRAARAAGAAGRRREAARAPPGRSVRASSGEVEQVARQPAARHAAGLRPARRRRRTSPPSRAPGGPRRAAAPPPRRRWRSECMTPGATSTTSPGLGDRPCAGRRGSASARRRPRSARSGSDGRAGSAPRRRGAARSSKASSSPSVRGGGVGEGEALAGDGVLEGLPGVIIGCSFDRVCMASSLCAPCSGRVYDLEAL